MVIELGGSVFESTHDLVGDLFRAKNAGVTRRDWVVRERPERVVRASGADVVVHQHLLQASHLPVFFWSEVMDSIHSFK
jgi:hypothetical protein